MTTPLDENLRHPLLDVFNDGRLARDTGKPSIYPGNTLEHCLHSAGWVERDLSLALEKATGGKYTAPPVRSSVNFYNNEKIETPNNYESDNIASELLETTEAEVIKSQANRLRSVDIEHTVGSMTTRISYWFSDPSAPEIAASDLSSYINKSVSEINTPHSPTQDHGNYKGIGHKKAMEIADHPTNYNREALEEALRTLSMHILRER